jgi:hypothetical protein
MNHYYVAIVRLFVVDEKLFSLADEKKLNAKNRVVDSFPLVVVLTEISHSMVSSSMLHLLGDVACREPLYTNHHAFHHLKLFAHTPTTGSQKGNVQETSKIEL